MLRAPHVTPLLLASMLARLPYGVFALAAILYLAQARGSYAVAGLVDGAFGLGAAAGAPWQSRLIDRLGQRRVLVVAAAVDVTATLLLIALTEASAPTVALVACGLAGGVAVPNVGGALRSGVRTLAFAALPVGFCFGAVEIALPGFADSHGHRELAGVLLATWSVGSLCGGILYGAIAWRRPPDSVYVALSALLPLGFLPALLAPSIAAMTLLILSAGVLIAPQTAACNQLIGDVAPAGAVTEAYAWPVTATLVGFAPGTAVGGALLEHAGWRWCFVAAALTALAGLAVVLRYRSTLVRRPAIVP